MDLAQFNAYAQHGMIGLLIILAGLIKIPKLELNIWNLLGRGIGRSINKEVMDKVDNLSIKVDEIEKSAELDRVRDARQRILRFNDEILCGQRHSKEHFDEVLLDITAYEHYCNTHKEYENDKAILAIETVREVYKQCMKTHDFLIPTKKED